MDVLPDIVINPTFPKDEMAQVREQLIAQIHQRYDDAGTLASLHVQNLLWGNDHVRGWVNDDASVRAIQRDDLLKWHKTWFLPGNAMLVVAGDVDGKKLKADLDRAFGGWKKATTPPTRRTRSRSTRARRSASSTSRARRRRTSASRSSASTTTTRGSSTRSCGTTRSAAARSARG